jgi:prepilin-type processing-associated H-X9-DG protein
MGPGGWHGYTPDLVGAALKKPGARPGNAAWFDGRVS